MLQLLACLVLNNSPPLISPLPPLKTPAPRTIEIGPTYTVHCILDSHPWGQGTQYLVDRMGYGPNECSRVPSHPLTFSCILPSWTIWRWSWRVGGNCYTHHLCDCLQVSLFYSCLVFIHLLCVSLLRTFWWKVQLSRLSHSFSKLHIWVSVMQTVG